MYNFFGMDGVLYKIATLIYNIMVLSLLWLLFSIPLFTIGASTTALFFVTTRLISNHERYLWRDFWSSFKSNFRQATLTWLMTAAIGFVLFGTDHSTFRTLVLLARIPLSIELVLISIYIYPIYARFDVKLTDAVKSAFIMANRHILTSVCCMAVALTVLLAAYLYPIFLLAAMGVYAYSSSFLFMRLFRKYHPEIDGDNSNICA
ncbi:MAG: DUF624 domain-containing protein [Peptococcaceae bacterium]|nr:DUF624 domain-containing protein [Peptococcaceae bacterium]